MGGQNGKMGRRAVTYCLLDMHDCCTQAHSSYGSLHKIKPDNTLGWIVVGLVRPNQWLRSYWKLMATAGREKVIFLCGINSGRLPMPQWMAPSHVHMGNINWIQ